MNIRFEDISTFERLKSVTAEYMDVKPEDLRSDTTFTDDLGMDSLDHVELVMIVEEEFGIEINDDEALACLTLKQAVDLIDRKLA